MTTDITPINYSTRDEEGLKDELVRRKPHITPEWTDDNDSDLGMTLMDEFVVAMSVLHFYVDRAAGEAFPETCIKRESLQKLFFFWNIPGKIPATVTLKFSIDNSLGQDVDIPASTQCQTVSDSSPVFFETDSQLTLKHASLTSDTTGTAVIFCNTTGFVAGQTVEIGDDDSAPITRTILSVGVSSLTLTTTVPTGFTTAQNAYVSALDGEVTATEGKSTTETLVNSDGTEFQQRTSLSANIIDDSLSCVINEGGGDETWTAQETFYESGATDKHFIWKRLWDLTIRATFGDGSQGKIPATGATMEFSFREGGGVAGNVGENTITQVNDQILVGGTPVSLTVTNESDASGGSDEMDLDEAKIRGPEILKTNDRYVSKADFIAGAKSVAGVGNANAVRVTEPGVDYNVSVYIIPTGGGLPSTALKNAVETELASKAEIRTVPQVFDPLLARIQIGGVVNVLSNYTQAVVQDAVEAALETFFSVTNQEFGVSVRESDVSRVIDEVDGVDYVDISKLTLYIAGSDVSLDLWNGDPSFSDIIVGTSAVEETWTIVFTSVSAYSVRGSVSGVQVGTGTLDSLYTSDNSEVAFTISSGGTPPSIGDTATFRTSAYRGNITVLDDEIPVLQQNDLSYSGGG